MVLKVVLVVAVAVIKRTLFILIALLPTTAICTVLDDDRIDVMTQTYQGGGTDVSAPAILIRKKMTENSAVSAEYLVDMVSGASIDVEVSASKYTEERTEYSFGVEYLKDKSIVNAHYTTSTENDYDAKTVSLGVSNDFFGDLTTVSMGLSVGDDIIGNSKIPEFSKTAKHYTFDAGLTQVITKYFIASLSFNKTVDEGYLQNPYRFTRFKDNSVRGWAFGTEEYPNTLSSDAWAIRGRYFIADRKVVYLGYREFQNTWGIDASNVEIGYSFGYLKPWTFDFQWREYRQSSADFYRDLFDFDGQTNFKARDKELSNFDNQMLSFVVSYDFTTPQLTFIKKSSINLLIDHIEFNYHNFRDLRSKNINPGEEPLYQFSANMIRLMMSVWY